MATPAAAFIGAGATLSLTAHGGTVFTSIAGITAIDPSNIKWSFDDSTTLGSTKAGGGVIKQFLPSEVDPGLLSISGLYYADDPGQQALAAAFANGALQDFQLQLPEAPGQIAKGNLYAFSAYVEEAPMPSTQTAKAQSFKCQLKLTTLATLTLGS